MHIYVHAYDMCPYVAYAGPMLISMSMHMSFKKQNGYAYRGGAWLGCISLLRKGVVMW